MDRIAWVLRAFFPSVAIGGADELLPAPIRYIDSSPLHSRRNTVEPVSKLILLAQLAKSSRSF
jgi:hypothetical protein